MNNKKCPENAGFLDSLFWDEFTPFFNLFLSINLSIKHRAKNPYFLASKQR